MNRAYEFLNKYHMTINEIDDKYIISQYHEQIKYGLTGKPESLAMIPTYINPEIEVIKNKRNIVIDAGGSNFRSAIAYFDKKNKCIISNLSKSRMPAIDKELSCEEFFDEFANNILPLLDKGEDIGLCFSYAVKMSEDMDGTLIRFAKEIKAPEVVGKRIGHSLLESIYKNSTTFRKIVVLNDTVSTLLGGKALTLNKKFDTYIGFIYGTGTNICYIEDTSNITYLTAPGSQMIINMESGDFNKFTTGEFDIRANANTMETMQYCFEKMTSGRYLGNIIYQALLQANDEMMFTNNVVFDERFMSLSLLSKLAANEECELSYLLTKQDKLFIIDIFNQLVLRAAKMCALALASVARYKAQDKSGYKIGIVAEGTTFNKLFGYRDALIKYLNDLLPDINYEIIQGDELNLIGTALASLAKTKQTDQA